MIFVAACGLVFIAALIAFVRTYRYYRGMTSWHSFAPASAMRSAAGAALTVFVAAAAIAAVVLGFLFLVISGLAKGGSRSMSYEPVETKVNAIMALNLGAGSPEGEFFLASGTYEDVRYFTYIKERNTDGALTVEKIKADSVLIYQDADPVMSRVEVASSSTDISFLIPNLRVAGPTVTSFHIPPGSIVQDYSIQP